MIKAAETQVTVTQAEASKVGATHWIIRGIPLLVSVLAASTAVIMIKASTEHPFLVASYRLLLASLILLPLFIRDLKRYPGMYTWRQFSWSVFPAIALALHFMTWITGARMTIAANSSLLVNLTPAVLPFFLRLFYREVITKMEILGTAFALAGAFVLSAANFQADRQTFWGNIICFASMLMYATYIALGRKNGSRLSLWLYIVPLYSMAGLICFGTSLFFINPIKSYTLENILFIAGLGIIPTVIGHSALNYSLKLFRGQVVGVANLGQPIFASIFAFLIFGEVPTPTILGAGILVFIGILIIVFSQKNGKEAIEPTQT